MTSSTSGTSRAAKLARGATPRLSETPCPVDQQPRNAGQYLCCGCWFTLTPAARRALYKRDALAGQRLRELHQQLGRGVPLGEVSVTP
jgi:hypothetical protein